MKLNAVGRAAMNNPARALAQRRAVAPLWRRLGGSVESGLVLEVGCGGGAGSAVVRDVLGASVVVGLDLDRKMLEAARRRGHPALIEGDASELPACEQVFDAVVDFGAIHLIPGWPRALEEVRRVLKPEGKYYFEWVTLRGLRLGYRLASHGFESMPTPRASQVLATMGRMGLAVDNRVGRRKTLASTQFVGDLIGVAIAS